MEQTGRFKKLLALLLTVLMIVSTMTLLPLTAFAVDDLVPPTIDGVEGAGTEADPYLVSDLDSFGAMTMAANTEGTIAADTVVYVEFTADIEIADTDDFYASDFGFSPTDAYGGKPAGKVAWRIDGKDHTISNMVVPLFGSIGATTDGIVIKNLTLSGDMTSTLRYAGMVVGGAYGELTVENVTTYGSLKTTKSGGNILVGGIVGSHINSAGSYNVTIRNCTNNADITQSTGTNNAAAGGILGQTGISGAGDRVTLTTIENCVNNGTITSDATATKVVAGGIVGQAQPAPTQPNIDWDLVVSGCKNFGEVTSSTDGAYCGAIVGLISRDHEYTSIDETSSAVVTMSDSFNLVADLELYNLNEEYPLEIVETNIATLPAPTAIEGVEGAGTQASPYIIDSLDAFGALTMAANTEGTIAADTLAYVEFTADIEIADTDDFYASDFGFSPTDAYGGKPAGKVAWRIDGKGHTISDMVVPLFGSIGATTAGIEIKNLTLSGDMTSTLRYAGMVVGGAYGELTVENVTTYGSLKTTKSGGNILLGGIVGSHINSNGSYNVTIRNCTNNADITQSTGTNNAVAGGILGQTGFSGAGNRTALTTVENCVNNGTIISNAREGETATVAVAAGGILGLAQPAPTQPNIDWDLVVTDCENNGEVLSETEGAYCGAVVGYMTRDPWYPNVGEGSSATVTVSNCNNSVSDLPLYTNSAELPLELVVSNNQTNVHTHTYDNNCDADCNTCDNVRIAPHNYTNDCDESCNLCEEVRTTAHAYTNACDATCNVCGATRTVSHTYDNIYDTSCNVCGASRPGSVGTKDNPYLVSDLESLMALMQAGENDIPADTVFYVEFTADIEIRDTADFRATPVTFNNNVYGSTNSAKIAWRIDGKGHTISNMVLPLFHSIGQTTEGVEIKNLNLSGNVISTQRYVGMLIGAAYGDLTVENVTTNGSVTTTKTSNPIHVGGIVGYVIGNNGGCDVTIRNCTNHANVTQNTAINSNSQATAGGIVGGITLYTSGNTTSVVIENCTNNGAIVSDGGASILAAGGVVGLVIPDLRSDNIVFDLKVTNCVNNGTASTSTSGAYCGALVGYMTRDPNYSGIGLNSSALVTLSNCTSTVFGLTLYTNSVELPLTLVVSNNAQHTHRYDNDCDADCNICGAERTPTHVYDNDCDSRCNNCNAKRNASHHYDNACDPICNVCDEARNTDHVYDNDCDKECNACEAARDVEHVYDDACDTKCNVCKEKREAPHVYDNACDERCNECNAKRKTAGHVYDNDCDARCNECGDERKVNGHVYGDEKDTDCDVCGTERVLEGKNPADTGKDEAPGTTPTAPIVLPTMPGCGGSLSSTYAVLAIVLLLGFAFVAKKREEN